MSNRKEIISSLVLLLFGAGFLIYDIKYPLDQLANPGPGVFPLLVGSVLFLLTVWQLFQSLLKSEPQHAKENQEKTPPSKKGFIQRIRDEAKPLIMVAFFIVYLLLVQWVGFFVPTVFFVIAVSKIMGAKGWVKPVALSAGVNIFCYLLFVEWLKLSFPSGIFY
jgi:putative tricarboxylic transport membrane protein